MRYIIRAAVKYDEPFLWKMLYYAAHMDEDGETSFEDAQKNPDLTRYVKDWGREMDVGSVAFEAESNQPVGAAWIRLLIGNEKTLSYIDDFTPELAIAVLPDCIGRGVGTQLLTHVLDAAKKRYSSVVLSVRTTNPAKRIYERLGFVVIGKTTNRVGTESFTMLIQFQ